MLSTPHFYLTAVSLEWLLGAGKARRTYIPRTGEKVRSLLRPGSSIQVGGGHIFLRSSPDPKTHATFKIQWLSFAAPEIPVLPAFNVLGAPKLWSLAFSHHIPAILVSKSWVFLSDLGCFLLGSWLQNTWILIPLSQLSPFRGSTSFLGFSVSVTYRKLLYFLWKQLHIPGNWSIEGLSQTE